jgi:hypothetical protein
MVDSMATVMKLLRLVNDKEKNHTLVMSDVAAKMKNKEYHMSEEFQNQIDKS